MKSIDGIILMSWKGRLMRRIRLASFLAAIILPAILLAPVLSVPMPTFYRAVEVAGYYQTTAFLIDGLDSFTYFTIAESSAGLHLHALLSAPLSALNVFVSGRVVSLISAVLATGLLAWIATVLTNWRVGVLAATGAWLHPLYRRLATSWMPEMLGIAMTLGVLAAAIKWDQTDDRRWYAISVVLLLFSIQNHGWEASILVPVAALAARDGNYRATAGYVFATIAGVFVLFFVKSFQPDAGSLMQSYAVIYQPLILFTEDWFFWRRFTIGSFYTGVMTLTIPIMLLAIVITTIRWIQHQNPTTEMVGFWLISGFAPLILLPGGYPAHSYYAWGTVAPLSLGLAWIIYAIATDERVKQKLPHSETILTVGLALIALFALIPAVGVQHQAMDQQGIYPTEDGHVQTNGHPLVNAGKELKSREPSSMSAVAFVGPWGGTDAHTETLQNWRVPGMMRVVVYAELFIKQRHILGGSSSPQLEMTVSDIHRDRCEQMVILDTTNRTASVRSC